MHTQLIDAIKHSKVDCPALLCCAMDRTQTGLRPDVSTEASLLLRVVASPAPDSVACVAPVPPRARSTAAPPSARPLFSPPAPR